MIALIEGVVRERDAQSVVVEAQGVGYELKVPLRLLSSVKKGSKVTLYTHLHLKQNSLEIYAFSTKEERDFFRRLLTVSHFGPKLALALLSFYELGEIKSLIAQNDVNAISKVPGLGRKTAQRLIVELKERLIVPEEEGSELRSIVQGALSNLGYSSQEIRKALEGLSFDGGKTPEELLREALEKVGGGG
jgi:Holliday junction DNA helicase RuvA